MSGPDLLFVYGTLRRGCSNEEARRLHAQATWQGAGRARGRLFRLGWYPALGVEPAGVASWVMGDVLRMAHPETTLAWLDDYEECGPRFPHPQEYRREVICIELFDAEVCAWAYLYTMPVVGLEPIPSGDWLNR
ncbi:MAG: gamma-glutamylcyclotransferase [Sphingobium sp.]|nr:gamma-glutamylcyclotransferase [Sphingobium sp.]MBP6111106.1 gamma-glutamylcyclotransferase [Sphingobium sp.]MBP8670916.1 gamma-glutamylcyclotransferase [Sphingobium sp.]MBP9157969.1 gamma-glutamylcyclotransferase [Sphingobium sp.]MCC6482725.1 gamma-glutamylcyclotransferase [Sphingomonadaceae bacterium]